MLRIHSHPDDETGEVVFLVDAGEVRLASIRMAADANFEDFAGEIANTVVARAWVRDAFGRHPEEPEEVASETFAAKERVEG